jgi:hypothetical protein
MAMLSLPELLLLSQIQFAEVRVAVGARFRRPVVEAL